MDNFNNKKDLKFIKEFIFNNCILTLSNKELLHKEEECIKNAYEKLKNIKI